MFKKRRSALLPCLAAFSLLAAAAPGLRAADVQWVVSEASIRPVTNQAGTAHDGTTTLPSVPTEKFVFGRAVSGSTAFGF